MEMLDLDDHKPVSLLSSHLAPMDLHTKEFGDF